MLMANRNRRSSMFRFTVFLAFGFSLLVLLAACAVAPMPPANTQPTTVIVPPIADQRPPTANELDACRRSAKELMVGFKLLDSKITFLLWADQNLDAQKPILDEFGRQVATLNQAIESSDLARAIDASNRATDLMWRLFRETKPMLDARPGNLNDPKKRYEMVAPIVADSVALGTIKLANTIASGQDAKSFQSSISAAADLVAQAKQAADQGNYSLAMQVLNRAVPPADEAIVGLPANSAGLANFRSTFAPTTNQRPPTGVTTPAATRAPVQVAPSATPQSSLRASVTPTVFLPMVTATATPIPGFAFTLGSAGIDYVKDLTLDRSGNTIVAGYFSQTVDFDPGSGVANLTSRGAVDNFIAKYDRAGNYRWAIGIGGAGLEIPHSVVTDPNDNIYIAGYFSASVDFNPGAGTAGLNSAGGRDVYAAKYDANGKYLWATGFGGAGDDEAFDLALDSAGNAYVTGIFTSTITLDGRSITSTGSTDIFVVSYDVSGKYRWGFAVGGAGQDHGHAIRVGNNGKVYLAGLFSQSVDFDPSANTTPLTSEGGWDAFLAQYDTNGNFQSAKRFGGRANDQVRPGGMALDVRGNLYLAGDFALTTDFDLGQGVANLTSKGSGDIFVAKYDANANYIWAIGVGGAGLDAAHRLAVDANENVYATGWFVGAVDFDPGAGMRVLNGAGTNGASDVFVAKYDRLGNLLWANGFGAPVAGQDKFSLGGGIALNALGNVVIGGRFYGDVDVDPSANVVSLKNTGESDGFVVHYDANGNLILGVTK